MSSNHGPYRPEYPQQASIFDYRENTYAYDQTNGQYSDSGRGANQAETDMFLTISMTPHLNGIPTPPSRSNPASTEHNESPKIQSAASLLRWWWLDILALATALASFATIIKILLAYDGKFQDAWPSDILTINGLVAILATICRGAFMVTVAPVLSQEKWNRFSDFRNLRYRELEDFALFDEASRGAWRSLQLLWEFKSLPPRSFSGGPILSI
ncbi:hypothetical protein DL770_009017 [Monosporascus sp. CRB-9-2]|nr:hypothetical protein DL770_009017 [Monosporascus sp. CRB-9-2]